MKIWLFQALPNYSLAKKIPSLLNKGDFWTVTKYRTQLRAGDVVILWQSGPDGGVYGTGELASDPDPIKNKSEWRVDIKYTQLLRPPIFRRDLIKHPVLRTLSILQNARGTVFPVKAFEWRALNEILSKDTRNIFIYYAQEENRFTNGLISLLELSNQTTSPLTQPFLSKLLGLKPKQLIESFRVLRNIDGTSDAELWAQGCCVRFETKIVSGTLREEQIREHLKRLKSSTEAVKALVLLTPDDSNSEYIKQILVKRQGLLHLEWRSVYKFLEHSRASHGDAVFSKITSQFLTQIHDCIFEQDFAGIIQKVNFFKGQIDPGLFRTEMTQWRKGDWWDTPRKYEKLDGTGRKLLLYDGRSNEKRILAEVEIARVEHKRGGGEFPWRNIFAKRPRIFAEPIQLSRIQAIAGFEDFGKAGGKDMTPYRNITREQYRQLITHA